MVLRLVEVNVLMATGTKICYALLRVRPINQMDNMLKTNFVIFIRVLIGPLD